MRLVVTIIPARGDIVAVAATVALAAHMAVVPVVVAVDLSAEVGCSAFRRSRRRVGIAILHRRGAGSAPIALAAIRLLLTIVRLLTVALLAPLAIALLVVTALLGAVRLRQGRRGAEDRVNRRGGHEQSRGIYSERWWQTQPAIGHYQLASLNSDGTARVIFRSS